MITLAGFLSPLLSPVLSAASGSEPAGGAALGEVIAATAGAGLLTAGLLALGLGHRSGRVRVLGRLAKFSERVSGEPAWAAIPSTVAAVSLITAVFGMYWDIALHIDVGRDAGPLANPAHYFILLGLFGIFAAGWLAIVLPSERPGPAALRITDDWYAPLGGVLICACGAFSLIGFPLDDVWHRLFGQDVTLWGPTHLMLIGGAAMTLIGIAVLSVEGMRASGSGGPARGWVQQLRRISLSGALLIGLSTFQAEFDFGVPQFRFVFQPLMIMIAAGAALVATRMWLGRGTALAAVAFFLLVRGGLALTVGPVLGETTPHLPLYIVEALLVEAVFVLVPRERPVALALWCGLLIGTVGLAAEWAWSRAWMPIAWPASLLPEAVILGLAGAVGGSLVGAWIGTRLSGPAVRGSLMRPAAVIGAAAIAASVGYSLYKPADRGVTARVTLQEVAGAPARTVTATVAIDPPAAAQDTEWLNVTAWQGDGLVVDRLVSTGPGIYRTTRPIPVHGSWKALIRLHAGSSLTAVPVYLPEDAAIPAAEVPARARFTRSFVADHEILQREAKDSSGGLTALAYGAVVLIALALLALLAWGLHRVGSTLSGAPPPEHARAQRPRSRRAAAAAR